MKLRNKKTGEIVDFNKGNFISSKDYGFVIYKDGGRGIEYNSLAEFNEEWEDYEEPKDKGYWYIDDLCRMRYSSELLDEIDDRPNNWMIRKLCGNYFDTREEAEKAVEKLKAWKRLKDKGFRFKTWGWDDSSNNEYTIYFTLDSKTGDAVDLDLLFGGEE